MKLWAVALSLVAIAVGVTANFSFSVQAAVMNQAARQTASPAPETDAELQVEPPTPSAELCQQIETQVANRLQSYGQRRQEQIQHYAQVKTSLSELITYLENKDYDLTDLKASLSQFEAQLQTMAAVMETHYSELDQTRQYACGRSDGEFREQLQKARQSRTEIRDLTKDIKKFYQTEIRPKVIQLKTQAKRPAK